MTRIACAVFCDFDGTVARRDVGYNLFRHFSGGRTEALLPDWKSGRISSREILLREAEMAAVTEPELIAFLNDFELDPGFPSFVERCEQSGIELFIVSDGIDLYINYLLARNGLSRLPLIANHGCLDGSRIRIEFPHPNRRCARCGSCKGERIREYRDLQTAPVRIVFIGDGLSDVCAVAEADVLFAKKDLERHCRMNNISYVNYDDFFDVTRAMERLGCFV